VGGLGPSQGRNFGLKSGEMGGPSSRHLGAEDGDAEGVERDEKWEGTPPSRLGVDGAVVEWYHNV